MRGRGCGETNGRAGVWIAQVAVILLALLPLAMANAQTAPAQAEREGMVDLTGAVIVTPEGMTGPELKAVELLLDEVEKRTLVRWSVVHSWPADPTPVVAIGADASLGSFAGPFLPDVTADAKGVAEGYRLRAVEGQGRSGVIVVGNDARGVLFGAGRLLRELRMGRNSIRIPRSLDINTAPKYPIRGHQMGYRPKVNTYDAWTVPMWEQYIRDLVVFGTNAIEMIPPRSDDADSSPHFPLPQIDMMAKISQLAADYGIAVWIWYPAMDRDYSNPATVEFALKEWGEVFARLPRIDAIFVPGGDPGHTQPKHMMALLEKETDVLHRTHPNAQMWMSPQSFTQEWTDEFLDIMQNQKPAWLTGIVYGPQNRMDIVDLRKAIPTQYPIRHYPDITHSIKCQFPVPDWDVAYVLTEEREVINPRPMHYAQIFRLIQPHTVGFITYSEGCNDDVNKIVWSALGWDPDADVAEVLRQYGRYFIGLPYEDDYAQALLALERNWRGPLLTNGGIVTTLKQVQDMEKAASPQVLLNWRFQQTRYRAYYDAYTRRRLLYETHLEELAMDVLRHAQELGSTLAIKEAETILDRAVTERVADDLRARVFEMAEALYQSIHMQLSVPRYKAIDVGRGANLDMIDRPLNNRNWLKLRFAELGTLMDEGERLRGIEGILDWPDPGSGGYYDDLGNLTQQPHLVREFRADADPENRVSPLVGFQYSPERRISWINHAESRYDAPLKMRYDKLDPNARYRVRAVYAGDKMQAKLRLLANDSIEIHPFIAKQSLIKPVEFDIPHEATAGGELTLTWYQEPGSGGNGRGCQVAEVWLIKRQP